MVREMWVKLFTFFRSSIWSAICARNSSNSMPPSPSVSMCCSRSSTSSSVGNIPDLGPFLICRWQRCLFRCVRNCSTNGSHEVAQLCTRDWTVAMSIELPVVWRQESMWMPSQGHINLKTSLILIYCCTWTQLLTFPWCLGPKNQYLSPFLLFLFQSRKKNAWVNPGDFLGFPQTPFNSLSLCRLYVSRCQVSSPRSMALNSGDQPSVLLIPPTPIDIHGQDFEIGWLRVFQHHIRFYIMIRIHLFFVETLFPELSLQ